MAERHEKAPPHRFRCRPVHVVKLILSLMSQMPFLSRSARANALACSSACSRVSVSERRRRPRACRGSYGLTSWPLFAALPRALKADVNQPAMCQMAYHRIRAGRCARPQRTVGISEVLNKQYPNSPERVSCRFTAQLGGYIHEMVDCWICIYCSRCFLPVDLYDRSFGGPNERKRQLLRRRMYWRRHGMVIQRK
jgi:hypothetical protein